MLFTSLSKFGSMTSIEVLYTSFEIPRVLTMLILPRRVTFLVVQQLGDDFNFKVFPRNLFFC